MLARLEDEVDLHTFRPRDVVHMARLAGFDDATVVTEELVANWVGWSVRTIEGSIAPGTLGMRWAMTAFRAYQVLTELDERVLQRVVPDRLFYNLILSCAPRPRARGSGGSRTSSTTSPPTPACRSSAAAPPSARATPAGAGAAPCAPPSSGAWSRRST